MRPLPSSSNPFSVTALLSNVRAYEAFVAVERRKML